MFNTEIKKMAQGLYPSCRLHWSACPMKIRQYFTTNQATVSTSCKYHMEKCKIQGARFHDIEYKEQPRKDYHRSQVNKTAHDEIMDG